MHVAYLHPGPHLKGLSEKGVSLHQISATGNHDPRIIYALWAIFRRERPDVVHTWLPQMDIVGGMLALAMGLPWVLAERSSADAYVSRLKDRVLRQQIGAWSDAVVANSNAGQTLWQGKLRRGARAHVVRNAVALDEIAQAPVALSANVGVQAGTPIAIFVGRLSYEKNIPLLMSIAIEVCETTDATFLVCGDGPLRRDAERVINSSSFRDRIKLLGHQSEVWSLLKASNVFVSTSAFEGQPNTVLEAMASECPLVVSDIPAHREFLSAESASLVPMEREEFVSAIQRTLQRGPAIRKQIAKARSDVERYDARAAALAYEMIYKEAVGRHS